MRHRSRTTSSPRRGYWRRDVEFVAQGPEATADSWSDFECEVARNDVTVEEMWDVSSAGSGHDHPCTHRKSRFRSFQLTARAKNGVTHYFGQPRQVAEKWSMVTEGISCYGYVPGVATLLPDDVVDNVAVSHVVLEHLQRVAVPAGQALSLGNFLLELNEIKQLKDNILNIARTWPSNTILGIEFGLKPLISDIQSIATALSKLQKNLDWLQRTAGRPVRVVTERNVPVPGLPQEEPVPPSSNLLGRPSYSTGTSQATATVKCVSWVTYPKEFVSSLSYEILAALHAFGLTNPLAVMWEATRLSFVVDWFYNVGALIDQLDLMNYVMKPYIDRETFHITVQRSHDVHIYSYIPDETEPGSGTVLNAGFNGDIVYSQIDSVYVREVGIPSRYFDLLEPSLRELWLSLLLVDQRSAPVRRAGKRFPRMVQERYRDWQRRSNTGWVSTLPRRHRRGKIPRR